MNVRDFWSKNIRKSNKVKHVKNALKRLKSARFLLEQQRQISYISKLHFNTFGYSSKWFRDTDLVDSLFGTKWLQMLTKAAGLKKGSAGSK